MATPTDIITSALREANFKAVGATPTADELAEGLVLLQALSDSLIGLVIGTKLTPWWVPRPQATAALLANYPASPGDSGIVQPNSEKNPPANVRLMMKNTSDKTVYFQFQPQDGAIMDYVDVGHTGSVTLDANGALFGLTGSVTQVTLTSDFPTNRNAPKRWIYRADVGSWVEIQDLALTSQLPFPTWFDDYWITAMAIRLSPRFGNDPRASTLLRYKEMGVLIRGQYEQQGIEIVGTPGGALTQQSYDPPGGSSGEGFGTGDPFS